MKSTWKADAERLLMSADSPSVLKTTMLHALVTTGRADAPSTTTFNRWVASLEKALLDWIHLGASSRSRMTRPPFDLNLEGLD